LLVVRQRGDSFAANADNQKRRSSARTPKRKRVLDFEITATFWSAAVLRRFSSSRRFGLASLYCLNVNRNLF
jgi:hypothetical protein